VRQVEFPADGRVVDALGVAGVVDRVEAVTRPDAGPDAVLLAGLHLGDQVRIGDLRAGHADQVEQSFAQGVPRGGDVGDAGRVHHRDGEAALDLAGEVQVRAERGADGRDGLRQGRVALDGAVDGADEVDAVGGVLLAAVSASSKVRPPGCASSSDIRMPTTKSGPTASRTARITRRGNAMRFSRPPPHSSSRWLVAGERKLSNRWPYASSSMPSRPPSLATDRRGGVVGDDPVQVPGLGGLREGAVRGLAQRRGGHHREPVAGEVAGTAAEMGDLAHDGGPGLVHLVGEPAQPRDDVVAVQEQVAERRRAVGRDDRRAADHREADPAPRLLHVVGPVAVLGHAVLAERRFVGGADHAVAQGEVLEPEGLEQGVQDD
jgi:hypothetical protein